MGAYFQWFKQKSFDHPNGLVALVTNFLNNPCPYQLQGTASTINLGEMVQKIALAASMSKDQALFLPIRDDIDFVDGGLCHLVSAEDEDEIDVGEHTDFRWQIGEPWILEAISKVMGPDAAYQRHLKDLENMVTSTTIY